MAVSLVILLALASCNDKPKEDDDQQPPPPPSTSTQKPAGQQPNAGMAKIAELLKNRPPPSAEDIQLRDIIKMDTQGKTDEALAAVNALIATDPANQNAYSIRGEIYSKKKQWDLARKDYATILQADPKNIPAKFNVSELKFMQKAYDDARPGFAELVPDKDWGDLASYRIFLCDLYGGHAPAAQADLDAFNKSGENPSFYFSNAAWHFYNKQPDEGNAWIATGRRIYAPWKSTLYTSSLEELGYLPAQGATPAPDATTAPAATPAPAQ